MARENTHVSADRTREMFDQICAVHSIAELLKLAELEGFEDGTLGPTFDLMINLTEEAMITASDVYLEKEKAGGES